jgi:hypothetical protein
LEHSTEDLKSGPSGFIFGDCGFIGGNPVGTTVLDFVVQDVALIGRQSVIGLGKAFGLSGERCRRKTLDSAGERGRADFVAAVMRRAGLVGFSESIQNTQRPASTA